MLRVWNASGEMAAPASRTHRQLGSGRGLCHQRVGHPEAVLAVCRVRVPPRRCHRNRLERKPSHPPLNEQGQLLGRKKVNCTEPQSGSAVGRAPFKVWCNSTSDWRGFESISSLIKPRNKSWGKNLSRSIWRQLCYYMRGLGTWKKVNATHCSTPKWREHTS